jgi:hypothetical protein
MLLFPDACDAPMRAMRTRCRSLWADAQRRDGCPTALFTTGETVKTHRRKLLSTGSPRQVTGSGNRFWGTLLT